MKQTIRAITIVMLLLVAACATQGPTGNALGATDVKVMKIGVITPLTGDGAVYGLPVQRVVDAAVDDVNVQWAKKGMRLEAIYEDGKCNGKDALVAAQKLVNIDGVKVIYGGMCSSETLGAAPFTEARKVILFSPLSSSPDVTHAGDYVFRDYPSDTAQVNIIIGFLKGKEYKTASLLSESSDYAQAIRARYKTQIPSIGITVVADETFDSDSADVRSEVTKALAPNPDLVIVIPQTIPKAAIVVKQLKEAGMKAQGIGSDVLAIEQTVKEAGQQMEGFYLPIAVFAMEKSPEFAQLKERTGCELGFYCASAYDGIFLLAEKLEQCGEDTTCIKEQLYATQGWDGLLSGKISFDENGDVRGQFEISQMQNGKKMLVG